VTTGARIVRERKIGPGAGPEMQGSGAEVPVLPGPVAPEVVRAEALPVGGRRREPGGDREGERERGVRDRVEVRIPMQFH